jgi:hypothetical protein
MRVLFFCLTFAIGLGGCSASPPQPNPTVVEREVVKSILKELCVSVLRIQGGFAAGDPNLQHEHLAANDGWIAAIETSLKTDEEASANPSATLLGPIIPGGLVPKGATAGTYNAAVGGTIDQTATTLRDNKHYLVIQSLLNDEEVCPPKGTDYYNAFFYKNAEYVTDGKYLTGKLGLYPWLYNGLSAHGFDALIDPTTLVVQGPNVPEPTPRRLPGAFFSKTASPSSPYFVQQQLNQVPVTLAPGCIGPDPDCPKPTSQITRQIWTQGFPGPTLSFNFTDPKNAYPLTYSAMTEPGDKATLPPWIIFDPNKKTVTIQAVPSGDPGFTTIRILATNKNKITGYLDIPFVIVSAPKATTWGPTYGATFTFLLKGSAQLGPSFSFDRSKGGAANLFSISRTETNYVNVALTSVGVPLIENYPKPNTITSAAVSSPDAINAAVDRLNETLLRLNLSNVFPP